jgi:WD40 repeat protein
VTKLTLTNDGENDNEGDNDDDADEDDGEEDGEDEENGDLDEDDDEYDDEDGGDYEYEDGDIYGDRFGDHHFVDGFDADRDRLNLGGDGTEEGGSDSSEDKMKRAAMKYISTITEAHNQKIRSQMMNGDLSPGERIAGEDYYVHGASTTCRSLFIWDGTLSDTPLVSIPICKSFATAGLHPESGRLVAVVKLKTATTDKCHIFVLMDTASLEIVCGFHSVGQDMEYPEVTFNPLGTRCLLWTFEGICVFDANSGASLLTIKGCLCCCFTLADEGLVSCNGDETVTWWEVGAEEPKILCSSRLANEAAATEPKISCSWFGSLVAIKMPACYTIWDYKTDTTVLTIPKPARDAVFTKDGNVILLRPYGEGIEVWNLNRGALISSIAEELALYGTLNYVYSRNALMHCRTAGLDYVEIWDIETGECIEREFHAGIDEFDQQCYYSEPSITLLM